MGILCNHQTQIGSFCHFKGPTKKNDCTIKTHTVNFFTHFSVLTSYFLSWPHFLFWVFINTSLFFYFLTYIQYLYTKCQIHSSVRFSGPAFNLKYSLLNTDQKQALTCLFFVCLRLVWDLFEINGKSCTLFRLPNLKLKSWVDFNIYIKS